MSILPTLVPVDHVPNEVMEELHCEFRSVDFSNYGTQTRGTQSKRLASHTVDQLTGVEKYVDPFSFDDLLVDNSTHCWHTRYMIRGYFKGRVADIRAIYSVRGLSPL
jgi:hypothetical protein